MISVSLCSLILSFTCCRSDCKPHASFCPHHCDQILPDESSSKKEGFILLMHFKNPVHFDWEGLPQECEVADKVAVSVREQREMNDA